MPRVPGHALGHLLHTSFLYHWGGRLTLPPREERIARVCQARLISGLRRRGKPSPLPPLEGAEP
jgi:hypothetical protein